MAKFKCEVVRCADEKSNRKAVAIFGVNESSIQLGQKHKAAIRQRETPQKKFTGPNKGIFP
jgi:hypothetical protein